MSELRWFLKRIRSAGLRRLRRLAGRGGWPVAKTLPGRVLRVRSPEHGDRLYYVEKGRRHWIGNGDWFDRNGFDWSTDVTSVTPDILSGFHNGGPAPTYSRSDLGRPNLGSVGMREIAASRLRGTGVEFGAGASPFPVPLECDVHFADAFAYESLVAAMYPGQQAHDLIRPDYVTDIKTLAGIPDASLDFIVACHVIEHTNNPIAAIGACHRALKPGGSVVLVVPDMARTFDSKRALTTLAHLIDDYERPSLQRDRSHYEEFYEKAFEIPAGSNLLEYAARKQAEGGDIHYHTWTYESFGELVDWCVQHQGWSVEFAHPTLAGPDDIEFYFVLTR